MATRYRVGERGGSDSNINVHSLQPRHDDEKSRAFSRRVSQAGESLPHVGGASPSASVIMIPTGHSIDGSPAFIHRRSASHTGGIHFRTYSADSAEPKSLFLSPYSSSSQLLSPSSGSSVSHSREPSQDFSSLPLSDDEKVVFNRLEFGKELEVIGRETNACNYLYLRRLLIKVLIDPKLMSLRDRLAELSSESNELRNLVELINKTRALSFSEGLVERTRQQKDLEKSTIKDIEKLFPTFSVKPAVPEHMWMEGADTEGNLDLNNEELRQKMNVLMTMLRPLSGEKGLEEGDITDISGYNRPHVAAPDLQKCAKGVEYAIPVEFIFTLGGKAVKLYPKDLREFGLRNFIRLHYAKQSIILSPDEWNRLPKETQILLAGEMLNDDKSSLSDTGRFDCKFVVAHGDQLPSGVVFSSREFRSEYEDKKTERIEKETAELKSKKQTHSNEEIKDLERSVKAKYDTPIATGQMFMNVLQRDGGFSDAELQFVRGFLHQGAINEVLEYCSNAYFPERKVPFGLATLSAEANRDPASTAKMEVIDWGDNTLEVVCEFKYDRYNMSSDDRQLYKADTTVLVRATACSSGEEVQLARVTMDVKVDRHLSTTERLGQLLKKKSAIQKSRQRAKTFGNDASRVQTTAQRKIDQARSGQLERIASQMMDDSGLVERFIGSHEEQGKIRDILGKSINQEYKKDNKKTELIEKLKTCQTIVRPMLGLLYPLPPWLHDLKPEGDANAKDYRLRTSDGRLISTPANGYVITNLPEGMTSAQEGDPPKLRYAISKDDLLKVGLSQSSSGNDSGRSSADESEAIKPVRRLQPRYSRRYKEHQDAMARLVIPDSSKNKLRQFFKVEDDTGENVIFEKVKAQIGADTQKEGWDDNLKKLCKFAGLDRRETRKTLRYVSAYFASQPGFKRQTSYSSLATLGVSLESQQAYRNPGHQGLFSAYSDPNLLEERVLSMTPVQEEPRTPLQTTGPKITIHDEGGDDTLPSRELVEIVSHRSGEIAESNIYSDVSRIVDDHIATTRHKLLGITGKNATVRKFKYIQEMRNGLQSYLSTQGVNDVALEMLGRFDSSFSSAAAGTEF